MECANGSRRSEDDLPPPGDDIDAADVGKSRGTVGIELLQAVKASLDIGKTEIAEEALADGLGFQRGDLGRGKKQPASETSLHKISRNC